MPQPCDPESNWTAGYDSDHNPFIMFEDIEESATRCDAHDLTWSSWTNDVSVNSIPNYSFITPNTTNDDHNSSIPAGDAWLKSWLSPLINDSTIFSNTAFVISFDESENDSSPSVNGSSGGHVYTVVVSPYSRGLTSDAFYNSFSLLTTAEWLLDLPGGTLGNSTRINDNWTLHPPMRDLFSFPPRSFPVAFTEAGLPPATPWSVTVGGILQLKTAATITFSETNGTYAYLVGSVSGFGNTPSSGSLTVNGTGRNVSVAFAHLYTLTFKEKGLPSGTNWSVTVGVTTLWSTLTNLNFSLSNGSYAYFVANVANYSRAPTGTVTVAGRGVTVVEAFSLVKYFLTFKEEGLPTGTNWSVTVGLTTLWSTLTYIPFPLPNGSYSYKVANVANYLGRRPAPPRSPAGALRS